MTTYTDINSLGAGVLDTGEVACDLTHPLSLRKMNNVKHDDDAA